jgi:hypothetical protein
MSTVSIRKLPIITLTNNNSALVVLDLYVALWASESLAAGIYAPGEATRALRFALSSRFDFGLDDLKFSESGLKIIAGDFPS